MNYKQEVEYLKQQYQTGPVKTFKGNDKTYLVLLDANLAKLVEQLREEIAKADKEYERWVSFADGFCAVILTSLIHDFFRNHALKLPLELGSLG